MKKYDKEQSEFSGRLKKLREEKEISFDEVSNKTGLAKSLLWRYETGKSEPGLSALITLANFFGVTLDWIAGGGEDNNKQHTGKQKYNDAIDKFIESGVSPERVEKIADAMKE